MLRRFWTAASRSRHWRTWKGNHERATTTGKAGHARQLFWTDSNDAIPALDQALPRRPNAQLKPSLVRGDGARVAIGESIGRNRNVSDRERGAC